MVDFTPEETRILVANGFALDGHMTRAIKSIGFRSNIVVIKEGNFAFKVRAELTIKPIYIGNAIASITNQLWHIAGYEGYVVATCAYNSLDMLPTAIKELGKACKNLLFEPITALLGVTIKVE
jgi:hypothetical protein